MAFSPNESQKLALKRWNKNVLVSAGAGSGKTAVLTERIKRIIESGVMPTNLLVLTFTKDAANEMRTRVKNKLNEDPSLRKYLPSLEQAYFTTFDSFSLSFCKKYSYLLSLGQDISIVDENTIFVKKNEILRDIFNEYLLKNDPIFKEFLSIYTQKSLDTGIALILDYIKGLDLLYNPIDKINELTNPNNFDKFYNDIKDKYNSYLKSLANDIFLDLSILPNVFTDDNQASDLKENVLSYFSNGFDFDKFNEIVPTYKFKRRNSKCDIEQTEEEKKFFAKVKDSISFYIEALTYKDYVVSDIQNNNRFISLFKDIILNYYDKINLFKKSLNLFEYNDIARMSIELLEKNSKICEEVKNQYVEILIDEYQDTSDLQEKFMSLIANDNLFMVGDIKQSIYRFRHANPNNFREKYNSYDKLYEEDEEHNGLFLNKQIDMNKSKGLRIDMTQNFRSRKEVLDNINKMFSVIMTEEHGNAKFAESHQMIYGNLYSLNEPNRDYNMKILNYDKDADTSYTPAEIEAFIVAKDILNRVNNKQLVQDEKDKKKVLRPIEFKDFCIICDRKNSFETLEAVLQHFGIPVSINQNEDINNSDLILTIFSIIKGVSLSYKLKDAAKNEAAYWHSVLSIYRSFLYKDKYSDNDTFEIVMSKNLDNEVSDKLNYLASLIDSISNCQIYNTALDIFEFFKNLPKYKTINKSMHETEYLFNMIRSLSEIGYHFTDISNYLEEVLNSGNKVQYSLEHSDDPGVKIMNIHKSKGLEFAVCYFIDLAHKPNKDNYSLKHGFDSEYSFFLPSYIKGESNGIRDTAQSILFNYYSKKDTFSERIRLFYVALTRAKEEIVLVYPLSELDELSLMPNKVCLLKDYVDMFRLKSGYPNTIVDLYTLALTHNYKGNAIEIELNPRAKYNYDKYEFNHHLIDESHISKSINSIIDSNKKYILEYGTKFHAIMENLDFKNPDINSIEEEFKDKVIAILSNPLFLNIKDAITYSEYEFVYTKDNIKYHGIIDLLAEYNDHIDIIDYKLSNTDSKEYIRQLSIYKDYVALHSKKLINCYLVSLNQNKIKKVD